MPHPKKLQATAHHESGHAVAAYLQELKFRKVTIEPEKDSLGHLLHRAFDKRFRPDLSLTDAVCASIERRVVNCFAGPIAEKKFTGRWNLPGARSDTESAHNLAALVHAHPKVLKAYDLETRQQPNYAPTSGRDLVAWLHLVLPFRLGDGVYRFAFKLADSGGSPQAFSMTSIASTRLSVVRCSSASATAVMATQFRSSSTICTATSWR